MALLIELEFLHAATHCVLLDWNHSRADYHPVLIQIDSSTALTVIECCVDSDLLGVGLAAFPSRDRGRDVFEVLKSLTHIILGDEVFLV